MIQCKKCNWSGLRHELVPKTSSLENLEFLNINNWTYCPKCLDFISLNQSTSTQLNLKYNNSVLGIISNPDSQIRQEQIFFKSSSYSSFNQTFVHLKRILDFVICPLDIKILGYKNYSNFPFNLNIKLNFEFESIILLKIIHFIHQQKFRCISKSFNNYECFGKWCSTSDYPDFPCSFCARFYEWDKQLNNGWPLSFDAIQKIRISSSSKPVFSNNKFAKIFNTQSKLKSDLICVCNELTKKPNSNCELHNENNFSRH
jgi:phosphotransferase system IIB component